ncbi:hypothetical protein CBFG_05298 [Clostridiales bacterium 1_7_47FAA]|nr:hypothetical protein CBFG_05298 [Clostridiales bacterium 1_7_47FAA]
MEIHAGKTLYFTKASFLSYYGPLTISLLSDRGGSRIKKQWRQNKNKPRNAPGLFLLFFIIVLNYLSAHKQWA